MPENLAPLDKRGRRSLRHGAGAITAVGAAALVAAGSLLAMGGQPGAAAAPARGATHAVVHVAPHRAVYNDSQSDNWSGYNLGYLTTSTQYTSISGTWVVPKATQHTKGQSESSATWIGIGGGCLNTSCTASDETLIQAGTEQDVSAGGQASYSAWYEIIPAPSVSSTIAVHPGDTIQCSISQSEPEVWDIVLKDVTDNQSFTESLPYASSELTAEWIEETPVVVSGTESGISELPNLSTVHFRNSDVNGKKADLQAADAVQLVNSNSNPLATPSNPNSAGTAFNDCTYASSCKAP